MKRKVVVCGTEWEGKTVAEARAKGEAWIEKALKVADEGPRFLVLVPEGGAPICAAVLPSQGAWGYAYADPNEEGALRWVNGSWGHWTKGACERALRRHLADNRQDLALADERDREELEGMWRWRADFARLRALGHDEAYCQNHASTQRKEAHDDQAPKS